MRSLSLALLVCACVLVTCAMASTRHKEGHLFERRDRLGHFGHEPWHVLYEAYSKAFVRGDLKWANDDYRNYMPTGTHCFEFLTSHIRQNYSLESIEKFVLLDACLGYVFDSEHQDEDGMTEKMEEFRQDPLLNELYHGTSIRQVGQEGTDCVSSLLRDAILIRKQFNDVCNVHMLETLVHFAECSESVINMRDVDSYLGAIFRKVEAQGHQCFETQVRAINEAVRKDFMRKGSQRFINTLKGKLNSLRKQANDRLVDLETFRVLKAVQGTTKQINYRRVSDVIKSVTDMNSPYATRTAKQFANLFLTNVADYCTKKLQVTKMTRKQLAADKAFDGAKRYSALVDSMCSKFRAHDDSAYFDYFSPFYWMVRMTEHEDVFGFDEKYFMHRVLNMAKETAPTYLAVSACNILTFTEGRLVMTDQNMPKAYVVNWLPNVSAMIRWPVNERY